ncbi:hypothetical protein GCM10009838_66100 [Catenulispora subtropica]|uniref:Tc1-like transposase DDE domain-containing protein n=1 Tax=Catenulispora subtropica TaxID=450798 RepID=A0ABP5E7P5_9ACTN
MKKFIAERDWLTVYQLPSYAPDLNPAEGIWVLVRAETANTAFTDPAHLIRTVRQCLREIQYRPWLIDGALAGTGLPSTATNDAGEVIRA